MTCSKDESACGGGNIKTPSRKTRGGTVRMKTITEITPSRETCGKTVGRKTITDMNRWWDGINPLQRKLTNVPPAVLGAKSLGKFRRGRNKFDLRNGNNPPYGGLNHSAALVKRGKALVLCNVMNPPVGGLTSAESF
jgi:hypothetical protein